VVVGGRSGGRRQSRGGVSKNLRDPAADGVLSLARGPGLAGDRGLAGGPGLTCVVNLSATPAELPAHAGVLLARGPPELGDRLPPDTAVWLRTGLGTGAGH
jgi:hypothetical protein